jgi:hypothetical protein
MIGPGPIFLFTLHRSGGTLLQRIVNAHPNVVIWGEHGGFINQLANADATLAEFSPVTSPISRRDIQGFLVRRGAGYFDPWVHPFERSVFRQRCRDLIFDSFSHGLTPGQRWGFKEIRYYSLTTARFLSELFPWSRFIVLRRDLKATIASSILAPWSLASLTTVGSRQDVEYVVQDCAHAACAMQTGMDAIAAGLPERVITVDFSDLAIERIHEQLFEFLALDIDDAIRAKIASACAERLGATPPGKLAGLGRQEIEEMAEAAIAQEMLRGKLPLRRDYRFVMGWSAK